MGEPLGFGFNCVHEKYCDQNGSLLAAGPSGTYAYQTQLRCPYVSGLDSTQDVIDTDQQGTLSSNETAALSLAVSQS